MTGAAAAAVGDEAATLSLHRSPPWPRVHQSLSLVANIGQPSSAASGGTGGTGGAVPDGVRLLTAPGVVVGDALSLSLSLCAHSPYSVCVVCNVSLVNCIFSATFTRAKKSTSARLLRRSNMSTDGHRHTNVRQATVLQTTPYHDILGWHRYERTDAPCDATASISQAPWPVWQRLGHARQRISELHVVCSVPNSLRPRHRVPTRGGSQTSVSRSDCPLRSMDRPP